MAISGFTSFIIGAIFLHMSYSLHNSMLRRVVRAPMRFFYSNPLGRIVNRFSKDTERADTAVAESMIHLFQVRRRKS